MFKYIILIIFILTFSQIKSLSQTSMTNMIREDDESFKKKREKWIESMHKTEPGINWRIIEQENRQSRIDYINKKQSSKLLNSSIANGHLKGTWIEKGSNNLAGRMHTADIDFDSQTMFAVSSGGNVWKSDLWGKNWKCLNNGMRIQNIRSIRVLKFGSTKRIIVAGNSPAALYYSDNDGSNWQTAGGLNGPSSWGGIKRCIVTGANNSSIYLLCNEWDYTHWYAITTLYLSSDNGSSFKLIAQNKLDNGLCDIWTSRYELSPVYLIQKDSVLTIDNNGIISKPTQYKLNEDLSLINFIQLQGAVVSGKTQLRVAFSHTNTDSVSFYSCNDNGFTWEFKGKIHFRAFETNSFSCSSLDPDFMLFGGTECYKSTDAGISWQLINHWGEYYADINKKLHADIPSTNLIRTAPNNEVVLICTDGGIFKSDDYASTVTNISLSGLNVSQYYSTYTHRKNANFTFVGSQDQGWQKSVNDSGGTLNFKQTYSGDYGHLTSSNDGDNIWSVYPTFTLLYTNTTNNIMGLYTLSFEGNNSLWLPPIVADPSDPNTAYLAGGGPKDGKNNNTSKLWKIFYDGSKLTSSHLDFDFSKGDSNVILSAIAPSYLNPNIIYTMTNNGDVFSSKNKGASWAQSDSFAGPGAHYLYGNAIWASQVNQGVVYIGGNGYTVPAVWKSNDFGKTFQKIDSGMAKTLIYSLAGTPDDQFLFAATEAGPYVYVASTNQWFSMTNSDSPDQIFWSVEYLPKTKTVRFGTDGRGIWDFKVDEFISDVSESINLNYPEISLKISPNPISGKTEISFNCVKQGLAKIKIYDFSGKLIKELFEGELNIGLNQFYWDCTSSGGFIVPDGFYLCILNIEGRTFYSKMEVIK